MKEANTFSQHCKYAHLDKHTDVCELEQHLDNLSSIADEVLPL